MLTVSWAKCHSRYERSTWAPLTLLDLSGIGEVVGVYVIWHGGDNPRWVRVGQGKIKDRLAAHLKDPRVTAYRQSRLFVTWAEVPTHLLDGVEKFLSDECDPLVGERFPDRNPIPVNLPM
jgi:hypothetical protein